VNCAFASSQRIFLNIWLNTGKMDYHNTVGLSGAAFSPFIYFVFVAIIYMTIQLRINNIYNNNYAAIDIKLIVFRRRSSVAFDHPEPFIRGAERVATMRVLGVVVNSKLIMKDQLDHLLPSCASSICALRMLRVHGLQNKQIHVVDSMTTLASILYASPAWWGFTTARDRVRIEKLMSRLRRGGYLPPGHPSY